MDTGVLERPMTQKARRGMPIRIEEKALEAARIAASYKGMTVMDYASKVLLDQALRDIEEGHRTWSGGDTPPPTQPRPKPRRPKGGD
jgi:hypothetical protein